MRPFGLSRAPPRALVERVDAIAEIPNSLRRGTPVRLTRAPGGAAP